VSNNKLIYEIITNVSRQRYDFAINSANIDRKGFMHINMGKMSPFSKNLGIIPHWDLSSSYD